jgi:hypothetical protein
LNADRQQKRALPRAAELTDAFPQHRTDIYVGHFLGQLACMGEHRLGSFAATKRYWM